LPRVAPRGGTARNQTRDLSITNLMPYHYTTKPHVIILTALMNAETVADENNACTQYYTWT